MTVRSKRLFEARLPRVLRTRKPAMTHEAGMRRPAMPAGQPDEPGPGEHDKGEPEEEKRRDPTERPEPRRKDAGMPATKDMRPDRRARSEGRLECGHRGEQARCDDGGEESQVLHLGSPILWIIGYRTATAFRSASVTA